jgi:histone H3/H4
MQKPLKTIRKARVRRQSTNKVIPVKPFKELVRQMVDDVSRHRVTRITGAAISALHESTEAELVRLFEMAWAAARHAGRHTLHADDIKLSLRMAGARFREV